jgi:hypothetical protein
MAEVPQENPKKRLGEELMETKIRHWLEPGLSSHWLKD